MAETTAGRLLREANKESADATSLTRIANALEKILEHLDNKKANTKKGDK